MAAIIERAMARGSGGSSGDCGRRLDDEIHTKFHPRGSIREPFRPVINPERHAAGLLYD